MEEDMKRGKSGFCKKHGYYENFTGSDKCPVCEYDKQEKHEKHSLKGGRNEDTE